MMILEQIRQFCEKTAMTKTDFGRNVANDPCLFFDIQNGREIRQKMTDKIQRFIALNEAANDNDPKIGGDAA